MKAIATRPRLALIAGASFLLFAGSAALAQQPTVADPGIDSFQQIIPPECFDPATGAFTTALSPAVCGVFEGSPGTEGGVGPTGAVIAAPDAATMAPAPGLAIAPTWEDEEAVAADAQGQLAAPSPQPEAMAPPEGDELPPPPPGMGGY